MAWPRIMLTRAMRLTPHDDASRAVVIKWRVDPKKWSPRGECERGIRSLPLLPLVAAPASAHIHNESSVAASNIYAARVIEFVTLFDDVIGRCGLKIDAVSLLK